MEKKIALKRSLIGNIHELKMDQLELCLVVLSLVFSYFGYVDFIKFYYAETKQQMKISKAAIKNSAIHFREEFVII